ncbi:MAG: L-lactate dehydrogenase [Chloroflexota bacterium]
MAVIGVGNVGATFAYALVLNGLVGEIVLVDIDRERAEGEAMDINHAVPLSNPVRVWAGDYHDCADADVVMVAAGATQRSGETRLDLVRRNVRIFEDVIPSITEHNTTGILLIATNPVDVLTYVALRLSGFPPQRVIGSGTVLDTARFRYLLSEHLELDPRNVHAYVVGEHGDSEVPVWSLVHVAGMRLEEYCRRMACEVSEDVRERISHQVRDAAYEVIERKGATYYAVAVALVRIVEAILRDQRTVLTASSLVPGCYGIDDVCLSLPAVVGRRGVERVVELALADHEVEALRAGARILQRNIEQTAFYEEMEGDHGGLRHRD